MGAANNQPRTDAQLYEHYTIEKELAARLRTATKGERRHLYNVVYDERLQRIPHHPLLTKAQDQAAQQRAVTPQVRLLQPYLKAATRFLEIGPGDGALALAVAQQVKQVYAVDVSEGLVLTATRPANFQFIVTDGIKIPLPPTSVDLAYSNQLMEHLHPEDAAEQLHNLHAALAPGAKYICITPNRLSGPWDISRHFDTLATGLHLKEYTVTELAATLHAAGFAHVEVFISYQGYHLSPHLPVAPVTWLEWTLEQLPHQAVRKMANLLTAVKVIATKGAA
ncbi:MAG: methyltransferase domain-containing protein [Caldilineaceae bacterium]